MTDDAARDEIRALAGPLATPADLDPLLDRVGDARFVLLGEASHGTSEYYRWRAELTKRLVAERGFSFVGVEGDWPDCFRVNRWVKGRADRDLSAAGVLRGYERWPAWMWANEEVAEFVGWLRAHNRSTGSAVGFYGLDVYSLWDSLREVLDYLAREQPDAVAAASEAIRCFDPYGEDPQRYAWATRMVPTDCEDQVVDLLGEVRRRAGRLDGEPEAELDAVQNAEVLAGAERYYRTMVRGDGESWNVRDHHMVDTLDRLVAHHGPSAKAVVWAHNTHVGDARATDMARAGMVNVGQLVRERHAAEGVVVVGFGSHRGSVVAADEWGAPHREMAVPAAPPGSHEGLLHDAAPAGALLVFGDDRDGPWLGRERDHRAIGVVYRPRGDRWANWVPTVMGARYDAFCWVDETRALRPLAPDGVAAGRELATEPWTT